MAFTVSVIEDDRAISAMYEFKLAHSGYEVTVAYDGVEGLKLVKSNPPDLILLDLKMPRMNGEDMLEKLRASEWGSGLRVVILTNLSKSEAPHKLRFLNVERYIIKAHHTPAQVVAIVNEILMPGLT